MTPPPRRHGRAPNLPAMCGYRSPGRGPVMTLMGPDDDVEGPGNDAVGSGDDVEGDGNDVAGEVMVG
jgi:hypothetical protein